MTFQEDLEFANKVLQIRTMMDDMSLLENTNFRVINWKADIYQFSMKGEGGDVIIGFKKKHKNMKVNNWVSTHTIINNPSSTCFQYDNYMSMHEVTDDEITEEWHFQNSLLMGPDELSGMMTTMLLHSVPTEFDYFEIKIRHIDDIIRMTKPL